MLRPGTEKPSYTGVRPDICVSFPHEYWRVSSVAHGQVAHVAETLGYFQLPIICFCGHLAFCWLNKVDVFGTGKLFTRNTGTPITI